MDMARRPRIGIGVVSLLATAMFINYVDRGNLSTAAPLIKDQLHLTNTQAGVLLSAFFWTYTPFQPVAGWLAERMNPYRTLALGVAIWSAATALIGLAGGFLSLFVLRLLLGIGESAIFPCNAKLLARDLAPERLGSANGLIGVGQALGPAIGTFAGGMLMAVYGWRPVFVLLGVLSSLWLLPWILVTRRAAQASHVMTDLPPPSFLAILRSRECWGASFGQFAHNYALYFLITWLPLYLVKSRGFSMREMSELGAMLYILYAISTLTSGLLTDRWMAAGASSTKARKTVIAIGHFGVALCMAVCALGGPIASVVGLVASGLFFGLNSATIFPIGQTLGGPHAAGKWMGVQNCLGNLAGILAPIVTGFVVDWTGKFGIAFAIAGAISLAGIMGWVVVVRRVETLDWG